MKPDKFAAQKAMQESIRLLLLYERPSPTIRAIIAILRDGMTRAMFKQVLAKEDDG